VCGSSLTSKTRGASLLEEGGMLPQMSDVFMVFLSIMYTNVLVSLLYISSDGEASIARTASFGPAFFF
jgi:hypothetical protein